MKLILGIFGVSLVLCMVAFMLPNKKQEVVNGENEITESLIGSDYDHGYEKPSVKQAKTDLDLPKIEMEFNEDSNVKTNDRFANTHAKERLEKDLAYAQKEIDVLNEKKTKLQNEMVNITPEVEQAYNKIKELEAKKEQHQSDIADNTIVLENVEKEYNTYHTEVDYVGRHPKNRSGLNYDSAKGKWYKHKQVRNLTWMDYQNRKSKANANISFANIQIKKIDKEIATLRNKFNIDPSMNIEQINYQNSSIQIQINTINDQIKEIEAKKNNTQEVLNNL